MAYIRIPENEVVVTWNYLLKEGARTQYGPDINVGLNFQSAKQLDELLDCLTLRIVRRDGEPREVRRSIVDITTKDYINNAAVGGKDPSAKDTTKVSVSKSTGTGAGRNYQFIGTDRLTWGSKINIVLKLLGLEMVGGFTHNQEEEISIPPGKRVNVKITTYSVSYELQYTVEFGLPKNRTVCVNYGRSCLCGLETLAGIDPLCYSTGYVRASNIVRILPGFREDDEKVYFTQNGILSWISDSCAVEKSEFPVQQMST